MPDTQSLATPAVIAAGVSAIVALAGILISAINARAFHTERLDADRALTREKLDADRALAREKFAFDKDLAERRFRYDRDLHDHKRKVELAEAVLSDFYQAVHVIADVRSGFGRLGDDEGLSDKPGEVETERRMAESFNAPLARLNRHKEFFAGIQSRRYRARAILGHGIEPAFDKLHEAVVEVQVAAGTLLSMVQTRSLGGQNSGITRQCQNAIWARAVTPDPIALILAQAVEVAESTCRPILAMG